MRHLVRLSALVGVALAVLSCAPAGARGRFQAEAGVPRAMPIFVSPAGKPFRASPGAPPPLEAWFREVDANGDSALSFAEFEADFRRFFALVDGDGDGEIEPAEVIVYETEILPEMASRGGGPGAGARRGPRGMGRAPGGGRGGGGRRGAGGRRGGGADGPIAGTGMSGGMGMGAARFGLLPIPHPIMAADLDFNRGVSRTEFDGAARTRFVALDTARDGRLTCRGPVGTASGHAAGAAEP